MKLIVLAAGQGTRLRPLTDDQPKCMVRFRGKLIIDYITNAARKSGINDIVVIDGYRKDVLEKHLSGQNIRFVTNAAYETTNMVAPLFCALPELNDDIVISYADIVYSPDIIKNWRMNLPNFPLLSIKDGGNFGVCVWKTHCWTPKL
jgi:choline kinase